MAAHERRMSKTSISSSILLQQLAAVLPKDVKFRIYHLSTPPTRTSALYSAPSGARADRTYCESHFLSASIQTHIQDDPSYNFEVLVFAIEILIYSTACDTTFFVSKADSTGYLHLLALPKGIQSPLRDITTTFLCHLLEQRQRKSVRSVVSLFARAQDQYLFPGSVEYQGKHVLDDRGLVRWWCKVLNPLIEQSSSKFPTSQWDTVNGYLIIPGLDAHETWSYIPKATKAPWTIGHPLHHISRYPSDVPPRCLIPHFPDDPKSRFLDELDEETTKGRNSTSGLWKSVKSVDQFWDMMAFRQECAAGRLVGFIWIVFTPSCRPQPTESGFGDSQSTVMTLCSQSWDIDSSLQPAADHPELSCTPTTSFNAHSQVHPTSSPTKFGSQHPLSSQPSISASKTRRAKKKKLSGPIIPRKPRVKTENRNYLLERPESTAYYKWTPEGRGQVIVEELDYKRVTELLLRLDFANLELATSSSRRWISEVRSGAWGSMGDAWGQTVIGTKVVEVRNISGAAFVNTLPMGLVRKKRKAGTTESGESPLVAPNGGAAQVNVLSASMVRKKSKI